MTILYSFLFCGTICLISQIIMNNSKLTFGHITSMFVVIGSFLGVFGIYDKIISIVGIGANLPIISLCDPENLLFWLYNVVTDQIDQFVQCGFTSATVLVKNDIAIFVST